jgi:universal stress protein A
MKTEAQPKGGPAGTFQFKAILAPLDFSPGSEMALNYAREIASQFGSNLTLLHVVEPPGASDFSDLPEPAKTADIFDAEKKLEEIATSFLKNRAKRPELKVVTGVAAHEIMEAAKSGNIDLIILASHGVTAWKYFCIGGTAERVARAAPCSVLIVREKEHEFR